MLDPKLSGHKGKLFGFVAVVFLTGMVAGALTTKLADRYFAEPDGLKQEKQVALQHLSEELDLTEEQARAVEAILDEFIMQQADLINTFNSSRLSGHDRIIEVLNDDQRRRFQEVLTELNTRRRD